MSEKLCKNCKWWGADYDRFFQSEMTGRTSRYCVAPVPRWAATDGCWTFEDEGNDCKAFAAKSKILKGISDINAFLDGDESRVRVSAVKGETNG